MKKIFFNRVGLSLIFVLLIYVHPAMAMENHGLISLEDFYSTDSSTSQYRDILTTRFRLDTTKIDDSDFSTHIDGRLRESLGAHDYFTKSQHLRFDVLNVAYESNPYYIAAGRLWPKELPLEHVDGVNFLYRKTNLGFGFFGGAKADPYTDAFDTRYTTTGAYVLYNRDNMLTSSFALVNDMFQGSEDRSYAYGQVSFIPIKEIFFFGTATADYHHDTKKIDLTNAIVELSYRPDFTKNISIGYNQFRAVKFSKSMHFVVDNSIQRSYHISGSYRFLESYNLYARVERQSLNYALTGGQLKSAYFYLLGLSRDNLFNTNININGSVTLSDSYGASRHTVYNLEASRMNWDVLQVVVNGSYTHNGFSALGINDNVWTYGAAAYLNWKRQWNIVASFAREQGTFFWTNTLLVNVTYRF
jgi:hypothetical protein